MRAYTKRLVDVHEALQTFICERGYAPTASDIAKVLHLSEWTVLTYMRKLEALGVLVRPINNDGILEVHSLYE